MTGATRIMNSFSNYSTGEIVQVRDSWDAPGEFEYVGNGRIGNWHNYEKGASKSCSVLVWFRFKLDY